MVVYRRERRHRPVLVMIVVTSLVLATLDQRGSGIIDTTRELVRDVVGPVQDLADDAFAPAVDFFDGFGRAGDLADENRDLRRRLDATRSRLAEAKLDRARVKELEALADIPDVPDEDAVTARVTAGSVSGFERTFRIDRGSDHGVALDMPVVVGRGLVGQVIAVSRTNATVRRIDDRRFAVGVRLVDVEGLGTLGIAQGQGVTNLMELTHLRDIGTKVVKNQLVVTSGLPSEPYPAMLPVATVERGTRPGVAETRAGLLRPIVDLDELDLVKVLRFKGDGTTP